MSQFRDPTCLDRISSTLSAVATICSISPSTYPLAASAATLAVSASSLAVLAGRVQSGNSDASKVLNKLKKEYQQQWREWSNLSESEARDKNDIESAIASFETYFESNGTDHVPPPSQIVHHGRDAKKISEEMLRQAELAFPSLYRKHNSRGKEDQSTKFSRKFFLAVIEGGIQHLLDSPDFSSVLQPAMQNLAIEHFALDRETNEYAKETNKLVKDIKDNQQTKEHYDRELRTRIDELKKEHAESLTSADAKTEEQIEKRMVLERQLAVAEHKLDNLEASHRETLELLESANHSLEKLKDEAPSELLKNARTASSEGPLAAFKAFKNIVDSSSEHLAEAAYETARLARAAIRYNDAIEYYQKAIAFNSEEPAFHNGLALTYMDMGLYDNSERSFLDALSLSNRRDPDYATIVNNLAQVYEKQGHYEKALGMFNDALQIRKETLEPHDLLIASTLNNIGACLKRMGRYTPAENSFKEGLAMYRSNKEGKNCAPFELIGNLGDLYRILHRFDEAEPLLLECLIHVESKSGTNLPLVATAKTNLAGLYKETGRLAKAEPLLCQALKMRTKSLPEPHTLTAESLNNLGGLYRVMADAAHEKGNTTELNRVVNLSLKYFQDALNLQIACFGENHPEAAKTMHNLAELLYETGNTVAAEPLLLKALSISKSMLGPRHESVSIVLLTTARLYNTQRRMQEAIYTCQEAYEICAEGLGEQHNRTLMIRNELEHLKGHT